MANVVTNPTADQSIEAHNFLPASGNTAQSLGDSAAPWNAYLSNATILTANVNGVQNAADYYTTDIGAAINSAIAALPIVDNVPAGTVYIPAGAYAQTTTIYLPRYVKLVGAGAFATVLNYTQTTGWAVVVSDALGTGGFGPNGGIEDITFSGPGAVTQTGCIYLGGSDGIIDFSGTVSTSGTAVTGTGFDVSWSPGTTIFINSAPHYILSVNSSTSITLQEPAGTQANVSAFVVGSPSTTSDPSGNYGGTTNFNRIRIVNEPGGPGFGIGVQWGNNAWSNTFLECVLALCGTNVFFPNTATNSGENVRFVSSAISNAVGNGIVIGDSSVGVDFQFMACSIDFNGSYNGGATAGYYGIVHGISGSDSTIAIHGGHVEGSQTWIRNFANMYVGGTNFVGGTFPLGYGIDQETGSLTMVGCSFDIPNGVILNTSGFAPTMVNCRLTNAGSWGSVEISANSANNSVFTGFLVALQNSQSTPYSISPSAAAIGWNYTGGDGEVDFWNCFSQTGTTNHAFHWYANVNGTPVLCASLEQAGNLALAGSLQATTVNATTGFSVNGTAGISHASAGVSAITLSEGIVTAFTASSDERLKKHVQELKRGLAAILTLNPITYEWNDKAAAEYGITSDHSWPGFSAQNVQKAIPEAVITDEKGYLEFNDRGVLGALVNAVKELAAHSRELRQKNNELIVRLRRLEANLELVG